MARIVVTIATEGPTDVPVIERVLKEAGLEMGPVYGGKGKGKLDASLRGYNNAAKWIPWLVLRDLDEDAPCALELVEKLLPEPSAKMCFRIAVHQMEAWLLADQNALADFLGISKVLIPDSPDDIAAPKQKLIELAKRSRKRDIREDIAPEPGSTARVGPAYTSRITEFAQEHWNPKVAGTRSRSLASCIAALKRFRTKPH